MDWLKKVQDEAAEKLLEQQEEDAEEQARYDAWIARLKARGEPMPEHWTQVSVWCEKHNRPETDEIWELVMNASERMGVEPQLLCYYDDTVSDELLKDLMYPESLMDEVGFFLNNGCWRV